MTKVLRLSGGARIDIAEIDAQAFTRGLSLQAWVCVERPANGQTIVELSDEAGRQRVLLAVGDADGRLVFSLADGAKTWRLTSPGVLQAGRWAFVNATLDPGGAAILYVDGTPVAAGTFTALAAVPRVARVGAGLTGRLAAVRIWQRPLDSFKLGLNRHQNDNDLNADGLLCGLRMAIADGQVPVVGEHGRRGVITGDVECVDSPGFDRLLTGTPGAASFDGDGGHIRIPPLAADFRGGVTLQAWVRPEQFRENARIFDLGDGEATDNMLLYHRGATGDVILEMRDGKKIKGGLVVAGATELQRWTQITAVVAADGTSSIFVNGVLAKRQKIRARDGVRGRCYVARSNWGGPTFCGAMAELRVWNRALGDSEVARNWCTRLRGDESGLVTYYRLDHYEEQGPVDLSPSRLHGDADEGVVHHVGFRLPLLPADLGDGPGLAAASRLLGEQVPVSALPADRLLADASRPAKSNPAAILASNITAYGPADGGFVACSVYEVRVEPPDDGDRREQLEVTFDGPVDVLVASGGGLRIERWEGRAPQVLARPDVGFWRLRVLAGKSLDCPAVRLRLVSMLPEESVVVRPAEELQSELLLIDPATLTEARAGGEPLCAPGTDPALLDTLARTVRQLAAVVPLPAWYTFAEAEAAEKEKAEQKKKKKRKTKGARSFLKQAEKRLKDAGKDLGDELERLGGEVWSKGPAIAMALPGVEQGSRLVLHSVESAGKLIERARKEAATLDGGLVRRCVAGARSLVIAGIDAATGTVELVGEWAGGVFRAVVSGLESALAAVCSFIERVGAELRRLIEMFSLFYIWERFLAATDLIHDAVLLGLDGLGSAVRAIPDPTPHLDALIEPLRARSLAGVRLGKVAPIKAVRFPTIPELDWVLSQLESGMGELALPISFELPKIASPRLEVAGLDDLLRRMDELFPAGVVRPDRAGELALEPIRKFAVDALTALRDVVGSLADLTRETLCDVVGQLRGLLTDRLKIPVFTDLMEKFVLGGRKLSVLRLAALLSAIALTVLGGPAAGALLVLLGELVDDMKKDDSDERAAERPAGGATTRSVAAVDEDGEGAAAKGDENVLSRADKQLYWCIALGELASWVAAKFEVRYARVLEDRPRDEKVKDGLRSAYLAGSVMTVAIAVMERDIALRNHGSLRYWSIRQANCQLAEGLVRSLWGFVGKASMDDSLIKIGGVCGAVCSAAGLALAGLSWRDLEGDASGRAVYNRTPWCFRGLQWLAEARAESCPEGQVQRRWLENAALFALAATVDEFDFAANRCS